MRSGACQDAAFDATVDGHVHTELCGHAAGRMEDYVRAALARGLRGVVFLEHCEIGVEYSERTWLTEEQFDDYWRLGRELQERYAGKINIFLGVELGYNPDAADDIIAFADSRPWDRVGLSHHYLPTPAGHLNMLSRKQANLDAFSRYGVEKAVSRYFDNLVQAVESVPADVLCHLDAPLRHHPDLRFTKGHDASIRRLLDAMAARGMALEINTSGYDHPRSEPYPSRWIIEAAAERGLAFLPGSDAHHPDQVGRHFDRLSGLIPG